MKKALSIVYAIIFVITISCERKSENTINLVNESDFDQTEVVNVEIQKFGVKTGELLVKDSEGNVLNAEGRDIDEDGVLDEALVLVDVPAKSEVPLSIVSDPTSGESTKMTQAEISVKEGGEWKDRKYIGGDFVNQDKVEVPADHTDHSYWIRYEGPGWESDLVGYRFYLDWRNGIDIFGKTTGEMVLQNVGLDGFDSYHEMSDWGLDVLKVGGSLGMGSIGRYLDDSLYRFQEVTGLTCEITKNGNLLSEITTTYEDWVTESDTVSFVSRLSIEASSRITKHQLSFEKQLTGFCTGIVKNKGEKFIEMESGDYRLLATYGEFSLNKDKLGMAVILKKSELESVNDSDHSHIATFKPADQITYYFLAAWEGEKNGIKSFGEFESYLGQELEKLNSPIVVKN